MDLPLNVIKNCVRNLVSLRKKISWRKRIFFYPKHEYSMAKWMYRIFDWRPFDSIGFFFLNNIAWNVQSIYHLTRFKQMQCQCVAMSVCISTNWLKCSRWSKWISFSICNQCCSIKYTIKNHSGLPKKYNQRDKYVWHCPFVVSLTVNGIFDGSISTATLIDEHCNRFICFMF